MRVGKYLHTLHIGSTCYYNSGKRIYVFGGYQMETDQLYLPRVDYYHIKRERWYSAFDLLTYDNESFRDIDVQLLQIPTANQNFKVLTTAYKFPLW